MPVTSSAPIALRYSVSIRPSAHAKLIQQNVLTVTSTESKSSNTASLVVLPAADHRQTPLSRTVGDLSIVRMNERYLDTGEVGFIGFARVGGFATDAGTHPIVTLQQHV